MTNPTRDGSAVKLKTASEDTSPTWEDPLDHTRDNLAWYLMKIERCLGYLHVPAGFRGTLLGSVSRAFGGGGDADGEGEAVPRCFASRESIGIVGGCSESSVRNWRGKFTRRQALRIARRVGGGVIVFPAIARRVPAAERVSRRRAPEFIIDLRALEAFCIQLEKLVLAFRKLKLGEKARRLTENENARMLHGFTEGIRALCGRGWRERRGARAAEAMARGLSALHRGIVPKAAPKAASAPHKRQDGPLRQEWTRRLGEGECEPLTDAHRERYYALIAEGNEPADAAALALGVAAELEKVEADAAAVAKAAPSKPARPSPRPAPEKDAAARSDEQAAPKFDDPEMVDFLQDLVDGGMSPHEAATALLNARNFRAGPPAPAPKARGGGFTPINAAMCIGAARRRSG